MSGAAAPPATSATLFCRVSSAKQARNYSREAQQRLGEEYAARHGLTVTRVFTIVETASKQAARAKWAEYLDYVRRGPEQHALVATVDRALRNFADLPELAELRKKYGKTVHFFLEGLTLDGAHASMADLRLGISTAVAVYYAGELREKTKRGLDQKALKGEWPNKAPYGYLNDSKTKRLVLDPEKARWVRRIKELAAESQHSIDAIVEKLLEEGCTLYGRQLHRNMVERVIRNPLYTARYEYPVGSGQWIQGAHEAIVSWDLHEAAIAGLTREKRARHRKHAFTFAGMIRCGCCPEGRAVVMDIKKERFVYAHCTGTRRSKVDGARVKLCPDAEFVPLAQVEEQAVAALASVQIGYNVADELYAAIAQDAGGAAAAGETHAAVLKGQLKRLEGRHAQAYADKLDGKIDEAFWRASSKRWGDEQVRLEEALRAVEGSSPSAMLANVKQVLQLAKDVVAIYKSASVEEKRRILSMTCSNWTLTGKKLSYKMKKPFAELAEGLASANWLPVRDAIRNWAAGSTPLPFGSGAAPQDLDAPPGRADHAPDVGARRRLP